MLGNLGGWHLLVILAIVLLLFGAAKLPALARSVGQSTRIFKSEMKTVKDDDEAVAAERVDVDRVAAETVVPHTPPKV